MTLYMPGSLIVFGETLSGLIRSADTIVGYICGDSRWPEGHTSEGDAPKPNEDRHTDEPSDIDVVLEARAIFEACLQKVLFPLRDSAARGLEFKDADGVFRKAHIAIANLLRTRWTCRNCT